VQKEGVKLERWGERIRDRKGKGGDFTSSGLHSSKRREADDGDNEKMMTVGVKRWLHIGGEEVWGG